MPTALIRALKASKPNFLERPLQTHQARFHHVIILRPAWSQLEQQYTEPRRKFGVLFVRILSSTPPNGNKAMTSVFSLDNRRILPRDYLSLLHMEEGKGKVAADNLTKTSEVAKADDEKSRLQTAREDKRKETREHEERNRIKEQEMEDKLGPLPEEPLAGDCCGQGCELCGWDTHWDELEEREDKRKETREQEERNRIKEQEMEDKIGPPPEKPIAGDCCGQGCDVCVWDTYWDELDKYKKLRKAAEEESG